MTIRHWNAAFLALCAATAAPSAYAQAIGVDEAQALRAQISTLKAQVDMLEKRLDNAAPAPASAIGSAAPVVAASAAPAPDGASTPAVQTATNVAPNYKVTWKGAPEISTSNGFSFKPRGRLQFDTGTLMAPNGIVGNSTGIATELRRAYLGAQGTLPGGFGYRFDVDFAPTNPEFTDTYLTWDHKAFNVTVGQHFPFLSLEQMTSDLDTSFLERAAFTTAFNFERRVGLSVGYAKGAIMLNAGLFTDNILDLASDADNAYSFDGRAVWMPKMGNTQFHLAGSLHWRNQQDQSAVGVRYRSRPDLHTTDLRFLATDLLGVDTELNYGLEAAAISGPFHFAAESNWMRPTLLTGAKPTFFGGYAEVGYFITRGDSSPYKKGAWGAIKPAHGIDAGGSGAIQVNIRYDRLDLSDAGIVGGTQDSYLASIVWVPVEHIKFLANYGHLSIRNSAVAAGTDRNYSADVAAVRAQVDF